LQSKSSAFQSKSKTKQDPSRDVLDEAFNEHGISWASWDYKEEFGIVDKHGKSTGIAEEIMSI